MIAALISRHAVLAAPITGFYNNFLHTNYSALNRVLFCLCETTRLQSQDPSYKFISDLKKFHLRFLNPALNLEITNPHDNGHLVGAYNWDNIFSRPETRATYQSANDTT